MLPEPFIDWWFAPWELDAACALRSDRLAQRDAYGLWCAQHALAARLPPQFDVGWAGAACSDADELRATARLFAGLMAARAHDQVLLASLSLPERKWCVSVAATQPLQFAVRPAFSSGHTLELLGLSELAWRLQQGFPGLWPRLRLLLEPAEPALLTQLDGILAGSHNLANVSMLRAQRCWQVCRQRILRVRDLAAEAARDDV